MKKSVFLVASIIIITFYANNNEKEQFKNYKSNTLTFYFYTLMFVYKELLDWKIEVNMFLIKQKKIICCKMILAELISCISPPILFFFCSPEAEDGHLSYILMICEIMI